MASKTKNFFRALYFPLFFVAMLWVLHFYKIMFLTGYPSMGIYPREYFGLQGIFTAPLFHADFDHLISNSLPLLGAMTIIFLFYRRVAYVSFALIYLLTGFAVWLFAREAFHIGASGVVYGLVSFIFWTGVFRRNIKSIILSLVVIVAYNGILYGILPTQPNVSWESHLFGAIVGSIVAYMLRKMIERDERRRDPSWINDDKTKRYYFERNIFEESEEEDGLFEKL